MNLITENHPLDPTDRRGTLCKPILIKQNARIGAGATILPGVTIGENAVVTAGAVFNRNIPDNTVVRVVPAKEYFQHSEALLLLIKQSRHISPIFAGAIILLHFDNDFSFSTAAFNIGHRFFDRFKRKNFVYNRYYSTGTNKGSDLF